MPLLQTLAIVFSCVPIPFAKNGGFSFASGRFALFLERIKNLIPKGVDAVRRFFRDEFGNPMRDFSNGLKSLDKYIASPIHSFNEWVDKYTSNDHQRLKDTLPFLFNVNDAGVANARSRLLTAIGAAQTNADNYKIGPFSLGELTTMATEADSLARAVREMEQHTDNLSGLGGNGTVFELQRLYGNKTFGDAVANTVNNSDIVSPNLSSSVYPIIDLGDSITLNSVEKIVIGKNFTAAPTGTVSITGGDVVVTTASVATLNLANCLLATAGTIKLGEGMYISVNGEVRQVNTINALGDYLTVYYPFYSSAAGQSFLKETSFKVNSHFNFTSTNQVITSNSAFVCSSNCLDNVIYGTGTTFTNFLQPDNKVYYDSKEYLVISVTNTEITVDDALLSTTKMPIYKIVNETPLIDLNEDLVDPDGIINAFTLPGSISGDPNIMTGLTTRVRRANGVYQTVSASKPTDAAQSLFQQQLVYRAREILDQMKYDLRDDAISALSHSDIVTQVNGVINRIQSVKSDVRNIVEQDIAVLNQAKSLVKGMVKLFSIACSKKKRKDVGPNDSDEYLDLITIPNPIRQGCDATQSDFIDILDDFDADYNNPGFQNNTDASANTAIPNTPGLNELDGLGGPFPRQTTGVDDGSVGDGGVDNQNPDVNIPEDPCAKPC